MLRTLLMMITSTLGRDTTHVMTVLSMMHPITMHMMMQLSQTVTVTVMMMMIMMMMIKMMMIMMVMKQATAC
jgi:hypothetical protein